MISASFDSISCLDVDRVAWHVGWGDIVASNQRKGDLKALCHVWGGG
ncbi:hypothetical protein AB1L30_19300 [Bremerella sp. JC817]